MMTGSEGVSFRLPQLFFSQQRLRKKRRGGGEKGEIFRTGEKKLNICLAHPHPRAETILPHSWPKATDKRGMRGVEKKRQKNFKKGRKGTTAHPTNSERAFKSEKPAGQSVTLILKSNAAPMQPHSACAHTHTHTNTVPQHPTIRQLSCPGSLLASHPLPPPSQSPLYCITKVPPPLTICHPYTSPQTSRVPAWPCPSPLRPPVRRPHSPAVPLALCLLSSVISQLWVTFGHLLAAQWQSPVHLRVSPRVPGLHPFPYCPSISGHCPSSRLLSSSKTLSSSVCFPLFCPVLKKTTPHQISFNIDFKSGLDYISG